MRQTGRGQSHSAQSDMGCRQTRQRALLGEGSFLQRSQASLGGGMRLGLVRYIF